ncbi:MAG: tRNA (N(6)-L-threonylcarbamoyladenosine(37)-C(2))-methylthiotransferase MtaB [Dehalococcoidales bacterium]|jgi:threonylcarbamoyladenosine tRNA methylthiotransferase MtaB
MNQTPQNPTVAIDSLGCKLNQAEIQQLARQLEAAGYRLVAPEDKADIYILNTCSVTHIAERKSRHLLRLAGKRNPAARLVAIGCYAHRAPEELEQIEGVDLVLGNDRKMNLLNLLGDKLSPRPSDGPAVSWREKGRTRAFLKIQSGCRNFCAYCIVPLVRSKEENVPPEKVTALVKGLVAQGYREVVLTGTEIGAYNSSGVNLERLIGRILAETAVPRFRLSSLQPHQITPPFIMLWQDGRLCPHFHISLQSGSDAVLQRMQRRYCAADYRRMVALIRESVPDAAITTDVIVGFPGETDDEFQETYNFCREVKFARIHVFPFSPRPSTAAATLPQQVADTIKKQRAKKMLALAKESVRDFQQGFLGKTMEVLWEKESGGWWSGLTGNYIKVYIKSDTDLTNKILTVKLQKIYRDGVWGEF